ncbi:uncharacterized protein MYCFIDRAFT_75694 [Pseudocercospora fijiensis CIRAD86]|uniref:Myb-like domain-containing protein n=1 Tax=Pseudocercospora fijiensis (strain CIRAD86) TaxID=383855 RepID=N1QAB8_PSEFD|nr:uncharacterized protein MYCFIDRAFT_75694 [Pseudocercospora fijiensis CIRAD86]EME87863.1 hypothetical protein MYCFIDRAFT_75694 [Pseudocercospora fijiensis CIRAD86]
MGRLATDFAAAATMADNLPQNLPRVSILDALLPRKITSPPKHPISLTPGAFQRVEVLLHATARFSTVRILSRPDRSGLVIYKRNDCIIMIVASAFGIALARPKVWLTDPDTGQPLGTSDESIRPGVGDHEIRKNKRGKMFMVHHKGSTSRPGSAVEIAGGKNGEKVSTEDVRKTKGGGDEKKDQAKADEKKPGSKEDESGFTEEEDAKLIEFKAPGKASKPWKEIAEEMGRSQQELKERWKVINPNAQGDGKGGQEGQGKGGKKNDQGGKQKQDGDGGDQKTGNEKQNKGGNNQQGGGKKGKGKNKEWTSDEDAKLKEMWAAEKPWGEMQNEFHCGRDVIQARWDEIGDGKEPSKQDSNDKKPGPSREFTEDDDKQLRELMKSGATFKTIAKAMPGKSKADVEDRWKEIDDSKKPEVKPVEPQKEEAKNAPSAKAASAKAASVASKARSHQSEVRFTMGEWMTLQEDELFTFQELQLLSHIIMRDPSQSWLRVASSFHDKTGRRVHPDDIREKFEAMAAMG